jgi:purine-nucleoside phosphorylase
MPQAAFVLGTGLKGLVDELRETIQIPYSEFENLPQTTAPSHGDAFFFGYLNSVPVLMMSGRFHYYEGYTMEQVTFPIRMLCLFPLQFLWISNAAGSVNPSMKAGDVVFIKDHINMMGEHPLRGPNHDDFGPRFPDMLNTYDQNWNAEACNAANQFGLKAHQGVYWAWSGPSLETPAEYNMIHKLGADLVGMSTVPEVLIAKHMGCKVVVSSIVSNVCYPIESIRETTAEQVIRVVKKHAAPMKNLVRHLTGQWIQTESTI